MEQNRVPVQHVDGKYIEDWLIIGPFLPDDPDMDFLTVTDGLPNNYVNDIHCGLDGVMWVSTGSWSVGSISRYDGSEFVTLNIATSSTTGASVASALGIEVTPALAADAEKILAYIQEHGSINNSECRDLLSVDRHRANYILQRMYDSALLIRKGELRWSRYYLP